MACPRLLTSKTSCFTFRDYIPFSSLKQTFAEKCPKNMEIMTF